ncbi:hypothetical protein PMIN06_009730 [Paraphaeosphaeria minitans]
MRGLMLPLLYRRLELSDHPTAFPPPASLAHVSYAKWMRKKKAAIQGLLRDVESANHVRVLKWTIGANHSLQSSRDLYRSFELLKHVEHVDINGTLFHGFAPDNKSLTKPVRVLFCRQ